MPLLSLRNVRLSLGGAPLLEDASLQIERGDRVCLLGRNGAGKSTLLRLLAGEIRPDGGSVDRRQGLRAALLPQEVPRGLQGTVFEVAARGLGAAGERLCRLHALSRAAEKEGERRLPELLDLQQQVEAGQGWHHQQRIEQAISRLQLDPEAPVASLSGGLVRRVLLARALAADPDLLLLDEPTNHLDLEAIAWLEEFLLRSSPTLVFVTHDRAFLRAVAGRIVELDRGRLYDFSCDYDTFLQRREELLAAEAQEQARFDRRLAEEEAWIRRGIKARRTRNEGRVRALERMREERRRRRERSGQARMQLQEADRSGRLVAELKNVTFGYGEKPVIRSFSTTVLRGDRIGIIGPNGAGKTTLLKLLLDRLEPQEGTIRLGTRLEVLYFDQLREQLDPDLTVQQNLSGDQDTVLVGGTPRHVYGYLQDFLFTPDRARTPVRVLSGGERNRLLLARLFTREANVLVLDEPTNDLDLETLELLEELLAGFQGTVFLVSHDRAFLDRVVTSILAFEGEGRVAEYVGGYEDWLRQRPKPGPAPQPVKPARTRTPRERPRRLGFRERRELETLPRRIEELEAEQALLHGRLADPTFYRAAGTEVGTVTARLSELEKDLEAAYRRWEELDELEEGSSGSSD